MPPSDPGHAISHGAAYAARDAVRRTGHADRQTRSREVCATSRSETPRAAWYASLGRKRVRPDVRVEFHVVDDGRKLDGGFKGSAIHVAVQPTGIGCEHANALTSPPLGLVQ